MTAMLDMNRGFSLDQPLHKACGARVISSADGHAEISFEVNEFSSNPHGALHGGILYAMMDEACYVAVAPLLANDQHAVSIEVHTSLLRAALRGETVRIKSHVDRLGRTLAAMRAEAFAVNAQGEERLIGTGNVTKSVLVGRKR